MTATYTLGQQIAEAKRELRLRERVYPRWVHDKKMSQDEADHQIALMAAILATLQSLQQPRLFAEEAT